ncbi:MAG TPA: KamA family radical SAM protein, partial [Gammaproteobacteria bacterium]|nr:KamA family radical SAM protein [Gammaproteobacteria bacterium]
PQPGLLHKYHGRALLVVTGACAIHCRYCFRRHFPYAETNPSPDKWQNAINYLKNDKTVTEVILSGGDPLTLADHRLSELLQLLAGIPHLQRLRIHSRMPVVLPERVNRAFIELLSRYRLPVIMVVHANHARELDDNVAGAARRIRATGTLVLNQSVLLRGVNDNVSVLHALSVRLFELGILPYYLHMPDPVAGTAHFAVTEEEARQIMQELNAGLPGYLVPKLVREIAGENSKVPVTF